MYSQVLDGDKDPIRNLQSCILTAMSRHNQKEGLLEQQLTEVNKEITYWINDWIEYLPLNKYIPIAGPFEGTVKAGTTYIKMNYSCLMKTAYNNTVHIVGFTPLTDVNDLDRDILTLLKLLVVEPTVKEIYQKQTTSRIHIFGKTFSNKVIYRGFANQNISRDPLSAISIAGTLMRKGYNLPRASCTYKKCPIRNKCSLLEIK